MVITVPVASATVASLLSPAQNAQINSIYTGNPRYELQNLGANDIYIEFGANAAVASSRKVVSLTGTIAWNSLDLSRVHVISNGGANANVRFTCNA